MKTAKLGAIFLVAIMAMTALGAAYAHWEETLTIYGSMTTDDIDPGFFDPISNDPAGEMDRDDCGTWNYDAQVNDAVLRDKNVGTTVVTTGGDPNTLLIVVDDAYPCYYAHPMFCIRNHGSVPVQVYSVQLDFIGYNDEECTLIPGPIDLKPGEDWGIRIYEDDDEWYADIHDTVNNDQDDYSIMLTGQDLVKPTQLDPYSWNLNDGHLAEGRQPYKELFGDLCVHFENGCKQDIDPDMFGPGHDTYYDFGVSIVFWNWPEVE